MALGAALFAEDQPPYRVISWPIHQVHCLAGGHDACLFPLVPPRETQSPGEALLYGVGCRQC